MRFRKRMLPSPNTRKYYQANSFTTRPRNLLTKQSSIPMWWERWFILSYAKVYTHCKELYVFFFFISFIFFFLGLLQDHGMIILNMESSDGGATGNISGSGTPGGGSPNPGNNNNLNIAGGLSNSSSPGNSSDSGYEADTNGSNTPSVDSKFMPGQLIPDLTYTEVQASRTSIYNSITSLISTNNFVTVDDVLTKPGVNIHAHKLIEHAHSTLGVDPYRTNVLATKTLTGDLHLGPVAQEIMNLK